MAGHVYCHYMYCNLAISVTPCIETNKLCVCVCVNVILFLYTVQTFLTGVFLHVTAGSTGVTNNSNEFLLLKLSQGASIHTSSFLTVTTGTH